MAEFGHVGIIGGGFCIDSWGAGPFVIEGEGKSYRFEDSDRFGPFLISKAGNPLAQQPAGRSSFWKIHSVWREQGRRVSDDGVTCLFDPPPPPRPTYYRKEGRKNYIIQNGDDGGKFIKVLSPERDTD